MQIFDVLRAVGKHHSSLSAGLLIGGKKEFALEQQQVGRMSLLVATPGRLLQHLEQTPLFDASQLQVRTNLLTYLNQSGGQAGSESGRQSIRRAGRQ